MKLLVVTGIVNSNWWPTYSALNSSMEKLADTVPDCTVRIHQLVKQKKAITVPKLHEALGVEKNDGEYILCDEKQTITPNEWAVLPKLNIVIFYSNPVTALANALSQKQLSLNESNLLIDDWAEQIGDAFRFYQQHKDICLMIDTDDVNKHPKLASDLLSKFVNQEISIDDIANNVSLDTMVAANLLLSERDDLFETFDEIRSSAPIFEDFKMSAYADNQSLANDSLKAIQANRNAKAQLNQQKLKLAEDLKQITKQLSGTEANVQQTAAQLGTSQEALKTSEAKMASLQAALEEANKKHQAEIAAAQQDKTSLANNVEQLTKQLSGTEANVQQTAAQLGTSQEALKTSEAKMASLQSALEEANKEHQAEIAALNQAAKTGNSETSKLKQTHVNLQSENELLVLQIGQLQETVDLQKTKFTAKAEAFNRQEQLAKKDNEMKEAEVAAQLIQLNEQNELCILQIAQLQEELESLYQSKQELSSQQNEQTQVLEEEYQVQTQQMQAIEAENEIATLQINQLQEELEFYYQQLQEKESQALLTQLTNVQPYQNVFEQSTFGTIEIKDAYEIDGYQDIQLLLNNVQLADGRQFTKLNLKLIEVSGRPGIEFRPSENEDESANLQWREDMQDEYGYFIRYIPYPNSEQLALQQKTNESLCASDRLLVLSLASKVADVFQMTAESDLPEGKLRDWKLIAIDLKSQAAKLPNWMSFDTLTLVEEMRTDNYEHLWLRFNNLLVNDHLRPEFEVKFAVTDLVEEGDVFSKNIMLEIRQQANQLSPLQAWPPVTQDEYGYKLQAFVDLSENELNIRVEEKLSDSDYQFLRHLLKNMVNFLQVLAEQGQNLDRPIQDWLALGNRITEISEVKSEIAQDSAVVSEPEQIVTIELEPLFSEHVDLGGYQHLVYQQGLSDSEELLFKIRAENINLQTKTAELYLELRTGNNQVPLADSEFFDEDEFGPRVLLPLAFLQSDLFTQQMSSPDTKLINMFSEEMNNLIETNSELDESQRALWLAMLANK